MFKVLKVLNFSEHLSRNTFKKGEKICAHHWKGASWKSSSEKINIAVNKKIVELEEDRCLVVGLIMDCQL